jgi:hypothetical protein
MSDYDPLSAMKKHSRFLIRHCDFRCFGIVSSSFSSFHKVPFQSKTCEIELKFEQKSPNNHPNPYPQPPEYPRTKLHRLWYWTGNYAEYADIKDEIEKLKK